MSLVVILAIVYDGDITFFIRQYGGLGKADGSTVASGIDLIDDDRSASRVFEDKDTSSDDTLLEGSEMKGSLLELNLAHRLLCHRQTANSRHP